MNKKEIMNLVSQSQCIWKPDTVYRRMKRQGMTLQEAMNLPVRSKVDCKRWYVYFLKDNDIIFYIGSGVNDRAWRHWVKPYINYDSDVAKKVREMLLAGRKPIVEIIKDNLSEQEARELESQYIREKNPDCNWYFNLKYEVWEEKFVSLEEIAADSRCLCNYHLLRNRINTGWSLNRAVGPKTNRGRRSKPTQGPDGKFCRI